MFPVIIYFYYKKDKISGKISEAGYKYIKIEVCV